MVSTSPSSRFPPVRFHLRCKQWFKEPSRGQDNWVAIAGMGRWIVSHCDVGCGSGAGGESGRKGRSFRGNQKRRRGTRGKEVHRVPGTVYAPRRPREVQEIRRVRQDRGGV